MGDSVKDLLSQRKSLADAGIDVTTMMWSDFMGRVNEKSENGATWRSRLVDFYTEHDPTKLQHRRSSRKVQGERTQADEEAADEVRR